MDRIVMKSREVIVKGAAIGRRAAASVGGCLARSKRVAAGAGITVFTAAASAAQSQPEFDIELPFDITLLAASLLVIGGVVLVTLGSIKIGMRLGDKAINRGTRAV